MFLDAGLADVSVSISMPVFREGDGKTVARLTLSAIADAAIGAGLTDRAEINRLLAEIEAHERARHLTEEQQFQAGVCRIVYEELVSAITRQRTEVKQHPNVGELGPTIV